MKCKYCSENGWNSIKSSIRSLKASLDRRISSITLQFACISIVFCGVQYWIVPRCGTTIAAIMQNPSSALEISKKCSISVYSPYYITQDGCITFKQMFMFMEYLANMISINSYYCTSKQKSSYFHGFLEFSKYLKIALDQLKHSGSIGRWLSSEIVVLESWWVFMAQIELWVGSFNTMKLVNPS